MQIQSELELRTKTVVLENVVVVVVGVGVVVVVVVCVCVCARCRGARCSLWPTVSKDLMRDLTVAPGSASASPAESVGAVGIMEMPHQ